MADADKKPNVFEILADILSAVRFTLEQPGTGGSAADWVKIARVRNYPGGPTDVLAKAVDLIGQAMNFMIWLNLEGQKWLTIGDGYRAYADMATDLAETLVSDDFRNALKALTGSDPLGGAASGIKWDPLESTCRHASLSIL